MSIFRFLSLIKNPRNLWKKILPTVAKNKLHIGRTPSTSIQLERQVEFDFIYFPAGMLNTICSDQYEWSSWMGDLGWLHVASMSLHISQDCYHLLKFEGMEEMWDWPPFVGFNIWPVHVTQSEQMDMMQVVMNAEEATWQNKGHDLWPKHELWTQSEVQTRRSLWCSERYLQALSSIQLEYILYVL